jgi:hypothetical protein
MKALNPFLLLIAATAFCVSARGVLGRSLSTELQSTTMVTTFVPTPTPATGGAKGLLTKRVLPITTIIDTFTASYSVYTYTPLIVQTSIATGNTPSPTDNHYKLPFDIRLWEYCGPNGKHQASGVYINGPVEHSFINMATIDAVADVDVKVNGLRHLKVGPLDPETSIVQVTYEGSQYTFDQCQDFSNHDKYVDTFVFCDLKHMNLTGDPLNSLDCGNADTRDHFRKMSVYCEAWFAIDDVITTGITVPSSPTGAV